MIGSIRYGYSEPGSNGGKSPRKSKTFILSSHNPKVLEAAAAIYGGEVEEWVMPDKKTPPEKYRLFTSVAELDVIPTTADESHAYEYYNDGQRVKVCDGTTCMLKRPDGSRVEVPCSCPKDAAEWKAAQKDKRTQTCVNKLRATMWLHKVRGLGAWILRTTGFYTSEDLPQSFAMARRLARGNVLVGMTLRLTYEQRGKYVVPIVRGDIDDISMEDLLHHAGRQLSTNGIPKILSLDEAARGVPQLGGAVMARPQLEAPAAVASGNGRSTPPPDDEGDFVPPPVDDDYHDAEYRDEEPRRPLETVGAPTAVEAQPEAVQAVKAEVKPARKMIPATLTQKAVAMIPTKVLMEHADLQQCDKCTCTVALALFQSGEVVAFDANGRQHEKSCGKAATGWDEDLFKDQ